MQTGQHIRDYVLGQKIGEGGMGEVWSAVHEVLHRPVAIKAMAAHLARDPQFEERFLQEARSQAILQHPRILGVTEFFREGGVYYLIMPLVNGQPLDDRLAQARGPLPLGEAAHIASDMLDALDYAHQRGIIHRDVKPSNILLDRDGRAYLTDFGIALLVGQDRRTRTGTSLGTPYYMSPEQIRSPKAIDHRSDVYSAACVIYEMLAGRPPFVAEEGEGDVDFVLKEAHLRRIPEPIRRWNPAVPAAVDAVVLRALAKEPNQRYGGCGEFRRALDSAVSNFAPPPAPPSPRPVLPPIPPPMPMPVIPPIPQPIFQPLPAPPKSRRGFLLGIGCGVVLAVAALVALGLALNKKEAKATFVSVRAEHNIWQGQQKGMMIHAHFTVEGAKDQSCQTAAYFYYSTGEILKDFNQAYRAPDGQVSVANDFTPPYEQTSYDDFTMFMPYDELHMDKGHYDLKFQVKIYYKPKDDFIGQSEFVDFTFDQS